MILIIGEKVKCALSINLNPLTIGYVKPCFIDKKKKTYKNISITGNTRKKKLNCA